MSNVNVVLHKKTGDSYDTLLPLTNDKRITITSSSSKIPENINSLEELIDALGSLAFEDYVALNVSDETSYGLVKLTNSDSEATDTAPTAKLLHDSMAAKVSMSGAETINGVKTFADGIKIGNTNTITYNASTDTVSYGAPIS